MTARTISQVVLPRHGDALQSRIVRSHGASRWTLAGVMVLAMLLALLMGLGAATGQRLVIIGLAGLAGGLAVLAVPVAWTFWTMVVMSFAIVGPATYFLRLSQLQWLPALFGLALYVQVLILLVTRKVGGSFQGGMPAYFYLLLLFWVTVGFSATLAGSSLAELLMASRYYIFVWGALMVFLAGAVNDVTIDRIWRVLLFFTLLQFPMVIYQYLFVARKRAAGEIHSASGAPPWDAVIGTFPGSDTGGGNSAAMATYVLLMIVLAVALWRDKHLAGWRAAIVVLAALGSMALAEVKAVVLLIPVALALYYRREILRHPMQSAVAVAAGVLLSGLLLFGYQKVHYDERTVNPLAQNADVTMTDRILNQFNPEGVNEATDRVGRIANVVRWWQDQATTSDIHRTLVGHGMGTTQESNLGVGRLVQRYGSDVGRSTLVVLLWETGVIGLVLYIALLASGAVLSMRLARDSSVPALHRTYLNVGAVALMLFLVTLPYKPFAVRLTSIQLLIILILGQAHYWNAAVIGRRESVIGPANAGLPDRQ